MHPLETNLHQSLQYLHQHGIHTASWAFVLGTGLGGMIELMDIEQRIAYADIPHFPLATVESHQGALVLGRMGECRVLAFQGRFHYYEGYTMQQVTYPVRVAHALGIPRLLLSNAAGGLNPQFRKGDLVLVTDHINLLPENPLRGQWPASWGPRFPDMSKPYDPLLSGLLEAQAAALGTPLKQGVYVAVQGPNLETRAEYRYLRSIGGDLVGMSTVPEVLVAGQLGLRCAAISVVTDECDPEHLSVVELRDILAVAKAADRRLSRMVHAAVREADLKGQG